MNILSYIIRFVNIHPVLIIPNLTHRINVSLRPRLPSEFLPLDGAGVHPLLPTPSSIISFAFLRLQRHQTLPDPRIVLFPIALSVGSIASYFCHNVNYSAIP